MSKITSIQWCDSTVNPIMGCNGCELFPAPSKVLAAIDEAVSAVGQTIDSAEIFTSLVNEAYSSIDHPKPGHKKAVNTTNIYHLRNPFGAYVRNQLGETAADAAAEAISKSITCYAAKLHMHKGASILNPDYEGKQGYAPIFEIVTPFAGRASDAAKWSDLLGQSHPETPWKNGLPRLIFVSDMGDALSAQKDFPFLAKDVLPAFGSEAGTRHLWLWLTKRPENMARLTTLFGDFTPNVCAMTTVTSSDPEALKRVDQLRQVKASIRGLSIEPLWERIPPEMLDLTNIDWVIVGGESGSGDLTRPFELEWAEELREHCKKHGVAFFLKQLGRNPRRGGEPLKLKDRHGGNWDEWDESLRIREFPKAFHDYRRGEATDSTEPRPTPKSKTKATKPSNMQITTEEREDFKRLNKIVKKGVAAYMEAGRALIEIQERKLWKAGGHETWESYCRVVVGHSKSYVHRIVEATKITEELANALPSSNSESLPAPISESQVRPLRQLPETKQRADAWASAVDKAGGQPTASQVSDAVFEILQPEKKERPMYPRAQMRAAAVSELKAAIEACEPFDRLKELVDALEALL